MFALLDSRRRYAGYDWGEGRRRWRVLDLGTTFAYLEAEAPRVTCKEHGVVVAAVPWAQHDSGFTRVESADEAASKVQAAGGRVVSEPFDVTDSGRMALCTDREGAAFCVWQAKRHKGARIVNEPGSLNFNGLNTRDAEGAKSFYGSVFGWETLELGRGGQAWRLPGYGDFLEHSDPGLRGRIAHIGAPEGFADVVATLDPIADDQPAVRAHWSVTFAVDDADATASKAAELGGQVVTSPFDAPWVRMTAITDPQGATFIASKFVPENKDLAGQAESAGRAA